VHSEHEPMSEGDERASTRPKVRAAALPGGAATVDEMSEASFPASDPPATWTWEVGQTDADADEADHLAPPRPA
jgi:hypothetical protein